MIGLYPALYKREIGAPIKRINMDDVIIWNLANKRFISQQIEIQVAPLNERTFAVACKADFLSIHSETVTTCFDPYTGMALWKYDSLEEPDRRSFFNELFVGKSGAVVIQSELNWSKSSFSFTILYSGERIGFFSFYGHVRKTLVVNNSIYVIGINPNTPPDGYGELQFDKLNLYEWDLNGNFVRKISLSTLLPFNDLLGLKVHATEDYLVVCAGVVKYPHRAPPRVLVIDLKLHSIKVIDLEYSLAPQEIKSIFIFEKYLFLEISNSNILKIDLLSGLLESKYHGTWNENGTSELIANNEYVVGRINLTDIFSLNLRTRIFSVWKNFLLWVQPTKLFIISNYLLVNNGNQIFINLKTGEVLCEDSLYGNLLTSFQDGKLLTWTQNSEKIYLNIRNFKVLLP